MTGPGLEFVVEGVGCGPTPEEAAAVIAALEQFVRDHAPAGDSPAPHHSPWRSAALREGVSCAPDLSPFWA